MSASKHDFTTTEIKAGALVVASLVILVVFLGAIRGCRPGNESTSQYEATFSDISGLNRGADVRFGGVKVGRVIALETDLDDRALIRVTAEVDSNTPVNLSSLATIEQITLTSAKHLEISTGEPEAPLHQNGDLLKSRGSVSAFGVPDLEGVITRLEALLDGVNVLVGVNESGDSEAVDLGHLLKTLDGTLTEGTQTLRGLNTVIENNRPGLKEIVDRMVSLETTATELLLQINSVVAENRAPLHATVENLQKLTSDATSQMDELGSSLQQVLAHFDEIGANASDLVDTQRPTLEEILLNLQETTRNLREFSRVLADRPESLVRGKGSQGRKTKGN